MIAKCLFKPDKNIKFAEASDKILPKVHKSGLTAKLGRKFTRGPGIQISGEDPAGRGPDGLPGSGIRPSGSPDNASLQISLTNVVSDLYCSIMFTESASNIIILLTILR